MYFQKIRDSNK